MDSARDFSFLYGSYVSNKRSHAKPRLFAKTAAPSPTVISEAPAPQPHLNEQLQLKIGKLTVEQGELLNKVFYLEKDLVTQKAKQEQSLDRTRELELLIKTQAQELRQAHAESNDLRAVLRDANTKIDDLEMRRPVLLDETFRSVEEFDQVMLHCTALKRETEKLRTDNAVLQKSNHDLEEEMLGLRQNISALENKSDNLGPESGDMFRPSHDAESVAKLEQERDDLVVQLKISRAESEASKAAFLKNKQRLEAQTVDLQKSLAEIRFDYEREQDLLRSRVQALELHCAELQGEVETWRGKHRSALQTATLLTGEKENLSQQTEVQARRLSRVTEELDKAHSDNEKLMRETANDVERQLRDAECNRNQLVKNFADQIAEKKQEKDMLQQEYEKRIANLSSNLEEEYHNKARLLEEESNKQLVQGKLEYEKLRESFQQHSKNASERFDQHVRTLTDRHSTDVAALSDKIKELHAREKEYQDKVGRCKQLLTGKDSELQTAQSTTKSLQLKVKELESKLKLSSEASSVIDLLNVEIDRLKHLKDPSTILDTQLKIEKHVLQDKLEQEYLEKFRDSELTLKVNMKQQVKEHQASFEKEATELRVKIARLNEELHRERVDMAKKRSDFVEKKRKLEEQITGLSAQFAADTKANEQQKHSEIRNLKESHERAIKKVKTENLDAIRNIEASHRTEVVNLEEKYKTERSFLQRQHREEQRDLLAKLTENFHGARPERDYLEEIQRLQNNVAQLDREHRNVCDEMEQSFSRVLAQVKSDHADSLEQLHRRAQEASVSLQRHQLETVELRKIVAELSVANENLQARFDADVSSALADREVQHQKDVAGQTAALREEYTSKLSGLREESKTRIDKLEMQLQELHKDFSRGKEVQEGLQNHLKMVLLRNEQLETNHADINKKLKQSTERFPKVTFAGNK